MSNPEIALITILCIGLLSSLYLSRYYTYKFFFKKISITPIRFLDVRFISFSFILWLLLAFSVSLPDAVDHIHSDVAIVVAALLVLFFFSLIMLIPYSLYKQHNLSLYKGVLLELLLLVTNYVICVIFMAALFLTAVLLKL